ncbi:MAG: tRNA (adenosine(37)-N6)-threonylcarbamoyltransferase complex dimerization subunit type 1 TsaB [Alphaproteobacteria bacterium]|nr:MAG: tRNA (adenosine(37)-N6)-threonylcarbamoyltransferase complex dimerization subunit type 1 TsaB [Alphaproteobacteria bacterium]
MLLIVDTTGRLLAFGLYEGPGEVVFRHEEDAPMQQAERLFPALAEALARHDLAPSAITRIAAIAGPGSYTGIRAGLAAASGLALALQRPALGIGGLEALAQAARDEGMKPPFVVALPVGRGRYAARRIEAWPLIPREAERKVSWVEGRELSTLARDCPLVRAAEGEEGEIPPPAALAVPVAARLDAAARLLWAADPTERPLQPLYLRPVQIGPARRP